MRNQQNSIESEIKILLKEKARHSSVMLCKEMLDAVKKQTNIPTKSFEFDNNGDMVLIDSVTRRRSTFF